MSRMGRAAILDAPASCKARPTDDVSPPPRPPPPKPPPPKPPPRRHVHTPEAQARASTVVQAAWRSQLARRAARRAQHDSLRCSLDGYAQQLRSAADESSALLARRAPAGLFVEVLDRVGPVIFELSHLVAGAESGAQIVASMRIVELVPPLVALLEAHARAAEPTLVCAGLAVITNVVNFGGEDLIRPTSCFVLLHSLVHAEDEGVQFYAAAALQNILTDPHVGASASALQALREAGVERRLAHLAKLSEPVRSAARQTLLAKFAAGALSNVRSSQALRELVGVAQLQRVWRRTRRRAAALPLSLAARRELRERHEFAAAVRLELRGRMATRSADRLGSRVPRARAPEHAAHTPGRLHRASAPLAAGAGAGPAPREYSCCLLYTSPSPRD